MTRKKAKKWPEQGRANRVAGTPGASKKDKTHQQQKQPAPQQPPKKKQRPSILSTSASSAAAAPVPNGKTTTAAVAHGSPRPNAQGESPSPIEPPQQQHEDAAAKLQPPPATTTIPFDPNERILLVGEGDFSFARSIVEHHGCADVLATCYDARDALLQKYPQAAEHVAYIEGEGLRVAYGVDATKLGASKEVRKGGMTDGLVDTRRSGGDAGGGGGGWDRVVFNFPHVGGKSTDVNRQVRYNQELLVSFFTSALPLLSRARDTDSPHGSATIIVTLFESEPYTLWNVKDLARHVGLRVRTSFRFRADAYPGYRHARTLGNVEGAGGAWRGEDRAARTYVFEAGDMGDGAPGSKGTKKRKKGGEESDSDDD